MQSKNTWLIVGLITIFLVAVVSILFQSQSKKPTIDDLISIPAPTNGLSQPNISSSPTENSNQPDPTSDWKAYAVPFLRTSVKVPPQWFILTDEKDKNHIRILSASPEASPEAALSGFVLDINKLPNATNIKSIVGLRIELTKEDYKEFTQKGKIAGENEVKIDNLPGLYRELQTQSGAILQLYLINAQGEVGVFESVPKDENQINIFKIIISTIKRL